MADTAIHKLLAAVLAASSLSLDMTRLESANGQSLELEPSPQPVDIRHLKLQVLKNALCFAIFAGLGGYSLASSIHKHSTVLSTIFYIVTALGLMVFIPRLAIATYKFMESSSKPQYDTLEEHETEFQYGV